MTDKTKKEYSAFDLFSHFTALRTNGVNRDEAWFQICDAVPDMSDVVRNAFLTLAKNWERREGHKYHYRTQPAKDDTLSRKEVGDVKAAQEQAQKSLTPPPDPKAAVVPNVVNPAAVPPAPKPPRPAALTGTLDPARLQEYHLRSMENVLDQLEAAEGENDLPRQRSQPQPSPTSAGGTAPIHHPVDFFGPRTVLLMYFRSHPHPLRVVISGSDELYIGRGTANAAMSPEIDLNPVNAGNFGVSRMHAVVTRRDNKLLIADLESMNFTYINGVRLLPNKAAVLKDGDEVWFGQLECRIRFQHT